jgi:gliding motility-associated-like protein
VDSIPNNNNFHTPIKLISYQDDFYASLYAGNQLAIFSYKKDGTRNTEFSGDGLWVKTFPFTLSEVQVAMDEAGNFYLATLNAGVLRINKVSLSGVESTTFGSSGVFSFTVGNGRIAGMTCRSNKIIVGGSSGTALYGLQLSTEGAADQNFGSSGYATYVYANDSPVLSSMTEDASGHVYLAGLINYFSFGSDRMIVRFNQTGLDTTFAPNGIKIISTTNTINNVRYLNNKLWFCGSRFASGSDQAVIMAINASNGNSITNFGTNGELVVGKNNLYDYLNDVVRLKDGTLLGIGYSWSFFNYNEDPYFVKFTEDGKLITTFGDSGQVRLPSFPAAERYTKAIVSGSQLISLGRYNFNKFIVLFTEVFPLDGKPDFPTGFSPNGDFKNDVFEIKDIDFADRNELKVYDRTGNLVYQSKNYQNNWDGTNNNGNPLVDGTYYFVFFYNDTYFKNYVEIRRK